MISLNAAAARSPPKPTAPLVVLDVFRDVCSQPVTVDSRNSLPDREWWDGVAARLRCELERMLWWWRDGQVMHVDVCEHDSGGRPTGELYISIFMRSPHYPLRYKAWTLNYDRSQRVTLTSHSHEAWCETWRSLYVREDL